MTDWPSEDAGSSATLFARGLPYTWTDLDLSAHFEHIGPIRRAFIVHHKHTQTSKGFGFVQFALHDDAQRGAAEMDGREMEEGRRMTVELAVKGGKEGGGGKGKGGAGVGEKRKEAAKAEAAQTKRQKVETAATSQQTMAVDEQKEVMPVKADEEEVDEEDVDSETSEEEDGEEEEEQQSAVKKEAEVKRAPATQKRPTTAPAATANKVKDEELVSEDDETAMTDDRPAPAISMASSPSSHTASHALLVTGIPPSATTFNDVLKRHSLHPTLVVFPAPESTLKRKAARLTFPSAALASQAATVLSATTLPAASAPLRCVALPSNAARLIVRNLPFHIAEPQLRKLLSPYGAIASLLVPVKDKAANGSGTVLNRGFGFVCYVRMEDAAAMMKAVNAGKQWGRQLAVDWSLDKQQYDARVEMAAKKEKLKDLKKEKKKATKTAGGADGSDDEKDGEANVKKEEDEDDSADEKEDVDMVKDEEAEDSGMEEGEDEDGSDHDESEGDEQGDDEKSSDDEAAAPLSPASSTASSSSSPAASPRTKPTRPNPSTDSDADCTLFIRNLAYETTEQSLFQKFSLFGGVKYARIVMERWEGPAVKRDVEDEDKTEDDTPKQRSKGVAFVRYYNKVDADKVLAICQQTATTASSDREKRMPSLVTLSESGIVLDNRQLNVVRAVDKRQASQLSAASTQKLDKRNLYLAREGVILPSSAGAAGVMGEDELKRRERYYREKKKKLDNPNFMVSRCRLSLRNLPMECEEKAVKKIMMAAVKMGRREERQKEREEARRAQEDGTHKAEDEDKQRRRREAAQEREANRRTAIVIRQVKVVRDAERAGAGGLGRSKRYGFIEFSQHEAALTALRTINAHSELWKEVGGLGGAAGGRVMVEFAVDDVRKVKEREERQRRLEKMREIKANMLADKERAAVAAEQQQQQQQQEQSEEARVVEYSGVQGAPTQKDKKRQAREAGVCYKCGEAGHQAKRCKSKKRSAVTKAEGAEADGAESVKDEMMKQAAADTDSQSATDKKKGKMTSTTKPATANGHTATAASKKKRGGDEAGQQQAAASTTQRAVGGKKAKVTDTEAGPLPAAAAVNGTAVQAAGAGKRRREDSAAQKLSKREKRELAGEAKFEAMVSEYKKKFLDTTQPAVSKGDGNAAGTAAVVVEAGRKKPASRWFDV